MEFSECEVLLNNLMNFIVTACLVHAQEQHCVPQEQKLDSMFNLKFEVQIGTRSFQLNIAARTNQERQLLTSWFATEVKDHNYYNQQRHAYGGSTDANVRCRNDKHGSKPKMCTKTNAS
uniref:Uncharacterized protein n=1 Tax=Populus alba TaxID=43335 RepID=A0A4U5PX98_POPAL|nr:hypothetical protein D5086_0000164130 [Populus alba]